MKKLFHNLLVSLILISCLGCLTACKVEKKETKVDSFFDYLETAQIVKLQIEADFSKLIENRDQALEEEALLSFKSDSAISKAYPIEISLRGKTRRQLCAFPPIKLNFSKSQLKAEGLMDFDKYKLVTHCMEDSELVLKEFLAYKLYNQLTEYSFRAHLVDLTYIDKGGEMETFQQYGILLENYQEMAQRLEAKKMPDQLPKNTRIPNEDYQRLALFQYMIGNTDWNLFKQHNIKWLCMKDAAIPVPYDFDFSGLVNAPYAEPHPSLPIDSVRERFLQWRGEDHRQLDNMRAELSQKQAQILQTCERFRQLSASEKEDIMNYLNDFFQMDQEGFVAN